MLDTNGSKMNPHKVNRERLQKLTDLPNIGPASAADLILLGFTDPQQLKHQNPYAMYQRLCELTQQRHDPCVIDVFLSITRFMDGEKARPWWDYTGERKVAMATGLSNS
jgi:hypothetical protein